jgi:hypothetical protein
MTIIVMTDDDQAPGSRLWAFDEEHEAVAFLPSVVNGYPGASVLLASNGKLYCLGVGDGTKYERYDPPRPFLANGLWF